MTETNDRDDAEGSERAKVLRFSQPKRDPLVQPSQVHPRVIPESNFENTYYALATTLLTTATSETATVQELIRNLQMLIGEFEKRHGAVTIQPEGILDQRLATSQYHGRLLTLCSQVLELLREKPEGFIERIEMANAQWLKAEKLKTAPE